jgi:hypothetical protein
MTAPVNPLLTGSVGAAVCLAEPTSKVVLRTIGTIALQILLPIIAAAFLLYFALPTFIALAAIPIAAVVTAIAISRLFAKEGSQSEPVLPPPEPLVPIPATIPCGLTNMGAADCWLNSIVQIIRVDVDMRKWFTEVPDQLDVHIGYFKYLNQELLENLPEVLPQQAYGDLDANDTVGRAAIDAYANEIRNKSEPERQNLFRYLRFLRQSKKTEVQAIAGALVEFRTCMHCYDLSEHRKGGELVLRPFEEGRPREPYSTANLRIALSRVGIVSADCVQQDMGAAIEGVIFDYLLPTDCRLDAEQWRHFDIEGKPPIQVLPSERRIIDGRIAVNGDKNLIHLWVKGSDQSTRNLLDQYFSDDLSLKEETLQRSNYQYPILKEQTIIPHPPKSLWMDFMRQSIFAQTGEENEIVEIQKTIEIQTIEKGPVEYKLDGCIVHTGNLKGGHYFSYRLTKDGQNNDVWYEMNDRRVTLKTETEMRKILSEQGYMFHYSKIEE